MCLGLGTTGCGEEDAASPAANSPAAATPAPTTEAGCRAVEAPAPKDSPDLPAPRAKLDPAQTYVASVATSCGTFEITLDAERAPRTGGAFRSLARSDFYDGTTFHRIVPGFVIQGGDPEGTGTGGPGFSVRETPPEDLTYTKGVVAMAKTGTEPAGTSGSQFFVVTGEDAQLPPDYALLGKVTAGIEVVDRIAAVPVPDPSTGTPSEPVVIASVTVKTS